MSKSSKYKLKGNVRKMLFALKQQQWIRPGDLSRQHPIVCPMTAGIVSSPARQPELNKWKIIGRWMLVTLTFPVTCNDMIHQDHMGNELTCINSSTPPSPSTNHRDTAKCLLYRLSSPLFPVLQFLLLHCFLTSNSWIKHTHTHTQVGFIHRSCRPGAPAEVTTHSLIFRPTTE